MQNKRRSNVLDWLIYGMGFLSIVVLIYLFFGRYDTKIVLLPQAQAAVLEGSSPKVSDSHSPVLPLHQHHEGTVPSAVIQKTDKLRTPDKSLHQDNEQDRAESSARVLQKRKSVEQKRKSFTKKRNSPRPKIKKSQHCISLPATSLVSGKKIRGFVRYAHPIKVGSKSYNWVVLKRYREKPHENLKKIGYYKALKGDTLYGIARKFRVLSIDIIAINRHIKNPDRIEPHTKIFIPQF